MRREFLLPNVNWKTQSKVLGKRNFDEAEVFGRLPVSLVSVSHKNHVSTFFLLLVNLSDVILPLLSVNIYSGLERRTQIRSKSPQWEVDSRTTLCYLDIANHLNTKMTCFRKDQLDFRHAKNSTQASCLNEIGVLHPRLCTSQIEIPFVACLVVDLLCQKSLPKFSIPLGLHFIYNFVRSFLDFDSGS